MEGWGVPEATQSEYVVIKGEKIPKVKEPYYDGLTKAFCPHCGLEVNRVWNMDHCGNCGGRIAWTDLEVKGYGVV